MNFESRKTSLLAGRSQLRKKFRSIALVGQLGPGLVTGAADDDPSGVATYSQAGAQAGYGLLWILVVTYPMMVAVQLISAQIARVTGKGLARNMGEIFHPAIVTMIVGLLFAANTINVGADLAAMGSVASLCAGVDEHVVTVICAVVSLLLQLFIPYRRYARYLKWLTLVLFAYIGVLFCVRLRWIDIVQAIFLPSFDWSKYATIIVAVFGTTISPYLFFWQSAQEVEELNSSPAKKPLNVCPRQAKRAYPRMWNDTLIGMGLSNLIGLAIMISAAATLHVHGIKNIGSATDAAKALQPIAGKFALDLFALGILGTGLLAVPVLAGSAAYAIGESRRWKCGLDFKPWEATGFYLIISFATLLGIAIDYSGIRPIEALVWTAVINGIISVPIMAGLMIVSRSPRQMGKFVISTPLTVIGWTTTIVMALAAAAMAVLP